MNAVCSVVLEELGVSERHKVGIITTIVSCPLLFYDIDSVVYVEYHVAYEYSREHEVG